MALGIDYNSGIPHTNGAPTHDPGTNGGKLAYDHVNRVKYKWVSGTTWEVDASGGGGGDSLGTGFTSGGGVGDIPDGTIARVNNAVLGGTINAAIVNFSQDAVLPNFQTAFFGLYANHVLSGKTFGLGFTEDGGEPFFNLEASGADFTQTTFFSEKSLRMLLYETSSNIQHSFLASAETGMSWSKDNVDIFSADDTKISFGLPASLKNLTETSRDALTPSPGWTIYCTDATANDASTGVMQTYNGSTWKNHL